VRQVDPVLAAESLGLVAEERRRRIARLRVGQQAARQWLAAFERDRHDDRRAEERLEATRDRAAVDLVVDVVAAVDRRATAEVAAAAGDRDHLAAAVRALQEAPRQGRID